MATRKYDVIVVGTRVAGASTAMLLARKGLRVLAVTSAESGAMSGVGCQNASGQWVGPWGRR